MRLTDFSAQNYLSHRGLNLTFAPNAKVIFIAGGNGRGKSAIAQGIKLALTGAPVRGLDKKNQLSSLITLGETAGGIVVGATADDAAGIWRINLKSSAHDGGGLPGNPISLDASAFFALTAVDRRKLLFRMGGLETTPDGARTALVDKGHAPRRVERVYNHLRLGFDAAATEAKTAATEARGGWKAITGENYGTEKAPVWKAPKPAANEDTKPIAELEAAHKEAAQAVSALQGEAAAITHAANVWKGVEAIRAKAAALDGAEAALTEAQSKRMALREEIKGMTESDAAARPTCPCPACGVVLSIDDERLTQWVATDKNEAARKRAELADKRARLQAVESEIAEVQTRIADGRAARAVLNTLPQEPAKDAASKAAAALAKARADEAFARSELQAAHDADTAQREASDKTARALQLHEDVIGYTALADALTNMPAEYLHQTLTKVNALLAEVLPALGVPVVLGDDMEVRYGAVPYPLASESQQWAMQMAVGYALAVMGGLGLAIVDRFDVLEPAKRGAVLQWLCTQDRVQFVLCATLKEKPSKLPADFDVHWLA